MSLEENPNHKKEWNLKYHLDFSLVSPKQKFQITST